MAAKKVSKKKRSAPVPDVDVEPLNQHVCEQVRELRKSKGWTLEQLASLSGVSRSMISQVERGSANPTLAVAFRIAQAFGVSLADLVEGASPQKQIDLVRHDDESAIFRDDSVCKIRTLSPLNLEKDVEFYEVTLHTKKTLDSAAHFSGTREFLTVRSGTVRVQSGGEIVELKKGDSAQYTADVAHSIENVGKGEAIMFLVDIYG
ncbi:MAG: helix-turn-helix domain-containing protein [Mariniblastus sp.]